MRARGHQTTLVLVRGPVGDGEHLFHRIQPRDGLTQVRSDPVARIELIRVAEREDLVLSDGAGEHIGAQHGVVRRATVLAEEVDVGIVAAVP